MKNLSDAYECEVSWYYEDSWTDAQKEIILKY